jgi:hypothetical protein
MVVLGMMFIKMASHATTVWDVTNDFNITNGNPNGAWTYGWAPVDFSSFTPLTNHGYCTYYSSLEWYGWNGDGCPMVWKNAGPVIYGVPTGSISLCPGPEKEPMIARWTAPSGINSVSIIGSFGHGDSGYAYVDIREDNVEVWSSNDGQTTMGFNLVTPVSPGETIDFAAYGVYNYGNTPLSATITAVPEPSSLMALMGGVGLVMAVRRKKRMRL